MKFNTKRSFEIHTCMKERVCIWCGKTIFKGSRYYSKPESNKMIARLLEEKTGYDIQTIKARTHFWYCDRVSWPFCSTECMSSFSSYTWETLPFNVRGRMGSRIVGIVNKIQDVIGMITALGGSKGKDHETNEA